MAESIKILADMKKELEKRVEELQKELERTKLLLSLIDKALGEQSFVPASELQKQAPQPQAPSAEVVVPPPLPIEKEEVITSKTGIELGKMYIGETTIRIVPGLEFDEGMPPFKSFLIGRVLEGMKSKDMDSGKSESEALSYEVVKDESNNVKELIIKNVDINNERIMRELRNSIKWTLERIKERKSVS
ncbi:MAG: hypothetical protein ACP5GU_05460 [Thermoprotei archaeon]